MDKDPQRLRDLLAGERLVLTTEEAAELLRVGRTTIYALIKAGDLHPVHIGRSCRISRAELERFVRHLQAPEPEPVLRRSPARTRTSMNQGGLFELHAGPVDEPRTVHSGASQSHRPPRLDQVDDLRQGGSDDGLR